jgi:soluble lytic murein transglycosylase-like protein
MMRWLTELLLIAPAAAEPLATPAEQPARAVVGMVLPVAPSAPPGTIGFLPSDPLAVARRRWVQGDAAGVVTLLEPWLESSRPPRGRTRDSAYLLAGMAQLSLKNPNLASSHFYQVRRTGGPLAAYGAWYEAVADRQRGRDLVAARECAAYRKAWPDGTYAEECLILMGDAYGAAGQTSAAAAAYGEYLELHPDSPREEELKLALVVALAEIAPEAAIPRLHELMLNHSYPSTDLAARDTLARLEAAGLDVTLPDDPRSRMRRAESLRRSGQFEASWAEFEALTELAKSDDEVATWVVNNEERMSWGNRRYDVYAELHAAEYAADPDPETAWKIFRAYTRQGLWDKAAALGVESLEKHKSHFRWRSADAVVARAEMLSGDFAAASKRYGDISGSDARFYAAFCAYKAGDWDLAQARLDAVIQGGGHWRAAGYYWRAAVHDALEQPEAAAADRAAAIEEDSTGWYWLLQQPPPEGEGWVRRDGRWHGGSDPSLPTWSIPESVPTTATGWWPSSFPILTLDGKSRQGLTTPSRDGVDWSALRWGAAAPVPPVASAAITTDAVLSLPAIIGNLPDGYTACRWYHPDAAMATLYQVAEKNSTRWPELRTGYDLASAGQYGEAARLLGPVYKQAQSGVGPTLSSGEWRDVFLAVRDHHNASRSCSGLGRSDPDEDAREAGLRLAYPMVRPPELFAHSQAFNIDPFLLMGIMRQESTYQEYVVSHAGAIGLIQVMPSTGARVAALMGEHRYSPGDLENPQVNIRYGAFYLSKLLDRFDGVYPLAVGSYNGGPHNVSRWMRQLHGKVTLAEYVELIQYDETRDYVKKVSGHYARYAALYGPEGSGLIIHDAPLGDDASVIDF